MRFAGAKAKHTINKNAWWKRIGCDSIMHTLAGAKLLKLIAVKLANRNAGEVERKTLHWNDGEY